jgi:outer membrane receptor protein involved in Fe transport
VGGDPAGHGSDCPTAPAPCAFGSGPLAPANASSATSSSSTSTTPKYGLSYQLNDANMFYASAAKGYRPAGASLRAPPICNPSLKQIGYVDANGNAIQPTTYNPDSVWSYEIGSKNRLLGGRLVIDSSVYEIKWSNIQLTVNLDCGVSFVDNLANATSKGFDLGFQFKPTDSLDFEGAVGYIDATFDEDATSPNGEKVIYNGGSAIPNVGSPWTVSLSANFARPLTSRYLGYARIDYTWSSEWRRFGATDPGTASYDPLLKPTPAYNLLNLRLGTQFRDFDLNVFVNNLTNSAPNVRLWSEAPIQSQDWHSITIRPRTYGLTLTWHM